MRKAIICTTNYQIFSAIGMINQYFSEKEKIDLFICDHIENYEVIGEKIKKENIFNNVYLIKESDVGKIKKILTRTFFVFKNFGEGINYFNYSDIYIAVNSKFSFIFYEKVKKTNKNLNMHLFEDGLGTYIENFSEKNIGITSKILNFLGRDIFEKMKFDSILLYEPSLYSKGKNNLVTQLPKFRIEKKFSELINRIFDIKELKNIDNKFIFFDQLLESKEVEEEIVLLKELLKKNLVVKPHPRKENNFIKSLNIQTINKEPMEILLSNNLISKKSVFLTYYSTSVFNADILYNQKYDIILMYKLLKNEKYKVDDKFEIYLEKFEKSYSGKIYIPKDREELISVLKNIEK